MGESFFRDLTMMFVELPEPGLGRKMDLREKILEGPNRCLHQRQRMKAERKAGEWRGRGR